MTEEPILWLDQSGQAAFVAGCLVVLITFFTSYCHVDIPAHAIVAQINAIESRQESERLRNETALL